MAASWRRGGRGPEFAALFKVAADFDGEVTRDESGTACFAELVGAVARQAGPRALDRDAVAALVEDASRRAGDAHKLSTHTRALDNLVREADREAARAGRATITRTDVDQAHDAWVRRSERQHTDLLDAVRRGMLLVATSGGQVGQVNGLAVTGSVDQHGRVQAVGGVDEKVEGFFDVCRGWRRTASRCMPWRMSTRPSNC
jgi:predicted ATP-dependent protease